MSEDHTPTPWMWAWRDDETAPASIFSMVKEGHAYAVAMCPRYQTPERWVEDAKLIVRSVNAVPALIKALEEIGYIDDFLDADSAKRMLGIARDALAAYQKDS